MSETVPKYSVDIRYAHDSNLLSGFNSPAMDRDTMHTWKLLNVNTRKGLPLTQRSIQEIQRRLTEHQEGVDEWTGTYRDRSRVNLTRDFPTAEYKDVPALMDDWLSDLFLFSPREMYVRFERIHPFTDGNGRTGRFLMWWLEKEQGIRPTRFDTEHQAEYDSWFKQ